MWAGLRPRRRALLAAVALALGLTAAACVPPPPPPPPPACPGGPVGTVQVAIFDKTNAVRAASGLGALAWNPQLGCLSQEWSDHMAATGQFSHRDLQATINSPAYGSYASLGENLFLGPSSVSGDSVVDAWMNSPLHRANLLGAFDSMGLGVTVGGDGRMWVTQNFGRWR